MVRTADAVGIQICITANYSDPRSGRTLNETQYYTTGEGGSSLSLALVLGCVAATAGAQAIGRRLHQGAPVSGAPAAPASGPAVPVSGLEPQAAGGQGVAHTLVLVAYAPKGNATEQLQCLTQSKSPQDTPVARGTQGNLNPPRSSYADLLDAVCANPTAAAQTVVSAMSAGKADADAAAAALKEARGSSDDRCRSNVPLVIQEAINSVNTGQSVPIDKIKNFAQNFATAMDDVGVPLCITVVERDSSGRVTAETYYFTGLD
ncbi:PPE family [Chlorella sorokiniana]|uniref:PPE family n=1 Tax=Chlorella sorokiniana TaxID=3076 RepID=A0A2P6U4Y3_CHLSO|nr:PPE family [Chlorella sorokiniana]|eukprot:PRW61375.1 PPE family [Chlorella sorokiniana]